MKEWQQNLVVGIVGLVIGISMVSMIYLLAAMGYILSVGQVLFLLLFGMFFVGVGVGTLVSTHTIYKLEKRISSIT